MQSSFNVCAELGPDLVLTVARENHSQLGYVNNVKPTTIKKQEDALENSEEVSMKSEYAACFGKACKNPNNLLDCEMNMGQDKHVKHP